jgi:uncharacterized protein YjiS (DUF1127 family)
MTTATATVNLRSIHPRTAPTLLSLLLRLEAWLDARAGRNALYSMDERALHDIGLTSADVDGFDRTQTWQDCLGPTGWR